MSLKAFQLYLICALVTVATGCQGSRSAGWGPPSPHKPSLEDFSSAKPAYIRTSFDSVQEFGPATDSSIKTHFQQASVALDLNECCSLAAQLAPIADAIDQERQALCYQGFGKPCVNQFLSGQALLQRNKAASQAGQLFLKLVEVQLQQQLLDESVAKLEELRKTSQAAHKEGIATSDADIKLDKHGIDLQGRQADLDHALLEITSKLNVVLGNTLCSPKAIYPNFELFPVYEEFDPCQMFEIASQTRPDLKFMNSATSGEISPECVSILAQGDARLGIAATKTIGFCKLLRIIRDFRQDCSSRIRSDQIRNLANAKQELVRLEITESILATQLAYRKLDNENDNLHRLEERLDALEAASDLDPFDAFIKMIEIWPETQLAKSSRISKAIDFETAKIKLLEATGQLISSCD